MSHGTFKELSANESLRARARILLEHIFLLSIVKALKHKLLERLERAQCVRSIRGR